MDDTTPFGLELLRPFDDVAVVELQGELDIYTAPQFKEALTQGVQEGATCVIVDLAKVTFLDSIALGVVVDGAKAVTARGGTLDIVCTDEHTRRIFTITGLDQILDIYPSRGEALEAAKRCAPGARP
jgi:anti-sigma B factor antagonist